jgi:FdhE protein
MSNFNWDRRIERAAELKERNTASREVLAFYEHILGAQRRIFDGLPAVNSLPQTPDTFRKQLDVEQALKWLPAMLDVVRTKGPAKLADEAARLAASPEERRRHLLHAFLRNEQPRPDDASSFFARAVFQPMAEHVVADAVVPPTTSATTCPLCDGKPQLAILRPEGDGGKRHLSCSFCSTEWEFRRVLCAVCGETDYSKLPRYLPEDPQAVRVEACDTCKFYLKSFDMTADGRLVPEIDEFATIALDLWAAEHGYQKIQPNVMGF